MPVCDAVGTIVFRVRSSLRISCRTPILSPVPSGSEPNKACHSDAPYRAKFRDNFMAGACPSEKAINFSSGRDENEYTATQNKTATRISLRQSRHPTMFLSQIYNIAKPSTRPSRFSLHPSLVMQLQLAGRKNQIQLTFDAFATTSIQTTFSRKLRQFAKTENLAPEYFIMIDIHALHGHQSEHNGYYEPEILAAIVKFPDPKEPSEHMVKNVWTKGTIFTIVKKDNKTHEILLDAETLAVWRVHEMNV